ncbi:MAG: hypothetical protein IKR48_00710 [Kiritimatiellae bacterium]|nr:hypothetical protein [Kiritimatiellia bacterium]
MIMRKSLFAVCLAIGASLLVPSVMAQEIIRCDFTQSLRTVQVDSMGSFHGVLPKGCGENFTGWTTVRSRTEEMREGDVSFLRFQTEGDTGQYVVGPFSLQSPGVFRVRVKYRSSEPLSIGIRQMDAPYQMYWISEVVANNWQEKEFVFAIRKPAENPVGLFFWTPVGTADLASLSLATADDSAIAALIRRPPKTVTRFLRHTRFPYGLPNAWNVNRECFSGTCEVDPELRAEDGLPVLKIDSKDPFAVWSEPFQTSDPKQPIRVTVRYRANGTWRVQALKENQQVVKTDELPPSTEWITRSFTFSPDQLAEAYVLRFSGHGTLRLDEVTATRANVDEPQTRTEVALAVTEGEIARKTRIHFADEPARARAFVVHPQADGKLRVFVANLYGERKEVQLPTASKKDSAEVEFSYDCFPETKLGQFRIEAYMEKDGSPISPIEEMIVTRIERPVAWGRDAPDSPFGCHFLPKEEIILTMKAGGINWARFHDACTDLTGWAHLEPQKGTWKFRDEEIHRFRDHHIKIFAQLGTAPTWATHYSDLGCRQMGYFERYLRPTNTLDWVAYVQTVVKRYNGVIDEYFIWNEPWGRWWKSAQDIRYYDQKKAGYDFGVFSRLTYQAAKRANPNARICGYNTYASTSGESWTREVESAGAYAACDLIDFHFYTTGKRCCPNQSENVSDAALCPIREQHPEWTKQVKPVYMSEGQGASKGYGGGNSHLSGMYRASVPWEPENESESIRIADAQCRYTVSLLAEGIDKVYLYTAHSYTTLAVKPAYLVLLAADGFPHPSYAAYAQLARRIEGKKFVRLERLGKNGGSYLFSDGKTSCRVLAELTHEELLQLARENSWRITDLFGNPVTAKRILPGTLAFATGGNKE